MNILAISGALRKGSTNTALLRALRPLAPADMNIEIATLHGIPLYDGDAEDATGKPQAVLDLETRIKSADGVIIATPEYNFSIPGVLKNATDWLSRRATPFKGKRTGVMGASGGPVGTARVQYHLRQNLQALEAIVMPRPEILVGYAPSKFDAAGNLTDESTRKHLAAWLKAFHDWVERKV